MTEKKNNVPASAEAPRKKKDGVFGQYFRKSRSTKTAAEIAAEIERVMRSEEAAAGTASRSASARATARPAPAGSTRAGRTPAARPRRAQAARDRRGSPRHG